MARKSEQPWHLRFTFGLAIVMFLLVIAYFVQSFHEMRKIKPVSVAIERVSEARTDSAGQNEKPATAQVDGKESDSQ